MSIATVTSRDGRRLSVQVEAAAGTARYTVNLAALQRYAEQKDAIVLMQSGDYWPAETLHVGALVPTTYAPRRPQLRLIQGGKS